VCWLGSCSGMVGNRVRSSRMGEWLPGGRVAEATGLCGRGWDINRVLGWRNVGDSEW
jgi:hypothetical protein